MLLEPILVGGVDLVAMAVAFRNLGGAAIDFRYPAAALERRGIGAKPHGAAEIAALRPLLQLIAAQPLRHQTDYRFGRGAELGGIGPFDADQIARRLDHRHLHAEADAKIGYVALACELRRADFALRAALAEAAGHQNAVDVFEKRRGILVLEHLALDPVEIDLHLVGDAAMRQRLDQRFVGVLHAGVFADDGNGHGTLGVAHPLIDDVPALQRRRYFGHDAE